ncbi:hypothetical protein [Bartonella henselae]|uniref:hypothetical protein n=1 Tax=Bartonella henselae TaxID=38323 RepID=UPI003159EE82
MSGLSQKSVDLWALSLSTGGMMHANLPTTKTCFTVAMDGGNADRKANFTLAERVYKQDFDIFMIQFSHRTDFNDLLLSKRGNNERKQKQQSKYSFK